MPILFLFEENMDALNVFLNMASQWIVGGMGSPIGLNYPSLDFVMKTLNIKNRKDCFLKIRVLEQAALKKMKEGS